MTTQAGGPLGRLALAGATVNRVTERRSDDAWLAAAWADPGSRVLVVSAGSALARLDGDGFGLIFVPPEQAPSGRRFLLGVDDSGVAYFGVSGALRTDLGDVVQPVTLRQAGALLSDRDAGLLVQAVALANWHDSHTHCPRCGAPTEPALAGNITVCTADGSQHFPRTDPAVIMLVTDPDDRCLLARGADWPERRMSVLAGFVEPGESAEQAVAREVSEETGIEVGSISYLGSQPWPLPRSLMLGFSAQAPGGQHIVIDGQEIAEAQWFSRADLLAAIEARELLISPSSSIARRLLEYWYGSELPVTEYPPPAPPPAR